MKKTFEGDCAEAPSAGVVFGLCRTAGSCTPDSPSATPADTVKFALHGGMKALVGWEDTPDLVVTGMNSGPNVSSSGNDSGTIGAAIAAIDARVPAVALSAGVDANLAVARETYTHGADYAAGFSGQLRSEGFLGSDFVVNVNYPDATGGKAPSGVEWSRVGAGTVAPCTATPRKAARPSALASDCARPPTTASLRPAPTPTAPPSSPGR